jgi:predicted nucleic acid-binding protein
MTAGGELVVDASVAVKWYLPEQGSREANVILRSSDRLLAPDLLVTELGNVLWKKVRRGELLPADAAQIAQAFVVRCPVDLRPSSVLLPAALDVATRFDRTLYDALYLALAVAETCPLVTADDCLYNALLGTPLAPYVRLLV